MSFNYRKLKGRIIEKFGTQREFAKACGISGVAMSMKMNNKMRFTSDDIVKMTDLLDIAKEEIDQYFFTVKV